MSLIEKHYKSRNVRPVPSTVQELLKKTSDWVGGLVPPPRLKGGGGG